MNVHLTLEQMHDLVDGLVPPSEEAILRAHLGACSACVREVEALEATVHSIRALPDTASAPEFIWQGIEARIAQGAIGEGPDDEKVVRLPVSGHGPRRFSLTLPQLAAAAVVVSLVSAAMVWSVMSGRGVSESASVGVAAAALDGPSARVAAMGQTGYEEAVVQLQTIIDQGRDVLSPETLTTLDASLRTIDDAIAEVRVALESDPSSELLSRLLANHQQSKLRVLRQAAISAQPRT